jgi:hypothetical protein
MGTEVIVASRVVISRQILFAAGGLLVGLLMASAVALPGLRDIRLGLSGIVVALLSAAILARAVTHWARPTRLVLAPEALMIQEAFKPSRSIRWSEVETFYVEWGERPDKRASLSQAFVPVSTGVPGGVVSYRLAAPYRLGSLAMGSDVGFGRAECLPSDDFQLSAIALAKRLNDYRDRVVAMQSPEILASA